MGKDRTARYQFGKPYKIKGVYYELIKMEIGKDKAYLKPAFVGFESKASTKLPTKILTRKLWRK